MAAMRFRVVAGGERGFIAALISAMPLAASLAAPSARIDPGVAGALERDGAARVCIVLRSPAPQGRKLRELVPAFRQAQDTFLGSSAATGIVLRRRFRCSPVLLADLSGAGALDSVAGSTLVELVHLDAQGSGGLSQSRALLGVDALYTQGLTGVGRTVAVLDSGIDSDHADLGDAVIHQHHFLGAGADTGPGAEDGHGHGTHVAGIIAARGTGAAPRGVAPGAGIVAVRVLDAANRGFLSDWALGVEHVVELHESDTGPRIDAINLSLVSDEIFAGDCSDRYPAFAAACLAAREAGIPVFAASGNRGSATSLAQPACFASVIAVGSVADTPPDRLSSFTCRGSELDLLAPGASITSAWIGGGAATWDGTSQASPHAAAGACLLRQASPGLPPSAIEGILAATGAAVLDTASGLTLPRIDLLAALDLARLPGDCNANGIADAVDIRITGTSADVDGDGTPDECEPPPPRQPFRRGDANHDSSVDIADVVRLLLHLFDGRALDCAASADTDDSGVVELTDAVLLLRGLFIEILPLPPPGTESCGLDPTPDGLECAIFAACEPR